MFIRQRRITKGFGPCTMIMASYIVWSILSLLLYNSSWFAGAYSKLSFFPFVYLFLMLLIAIWPGIQYERALVTSIQKPNKHLLYIFFIIYGICSIIVLIVSLPHLTDGIVHLLSDSDAGQIMYEEANAADSHSDLSSQNVTSGVLSIFNTIHALFRDPSIFFLFYYLTLRNRNNSIVFFLIVILVSDLLISLAGGGRTSFVMILLTILVAYFLFKEFLDVKIRKSIRSIGIVMILLVSIPFMALTISRWSDSSANGGTVGGLLSYAGQSTLNFNEYCLDANGTREGSRTAGYFKYLLGLSERQNVRSVRNTYYYMKLNDTYFSTFVGDFVLDYGPILAALIFVLFSFFFSKLTKPSSRKMPFHRLLALFFALSVCGQGGMYLFNYSFGNNLIILAYLFLYVVFYLDYLTQNQNNNHSYIEKS